MKKPVHLRYSHARAHNYTALEGKLELNSDNAVSSRYDFGSGDSKIKYTYSHKGLTTVEPGYNFGSKAWKLAVSQKFNAGDVVKASYKSDKKVLGVDFVKNSGDGSFKVWIPEFWYCLWFVFVLFNWIGIWWIVYLFAGIF